MSWQKLTWVFLPHSRLRPKVLDIEACEAGGWSPVPEFASFIVREAGDQLLRVLVEFGVGELLCGGRR
jgi:hypothetical protein